jgi:hypothetical protein
MGLFARKTIYKDDTIGSYTGIVVTDDEAYAEPYNTSHWYCQLNLNHSDLLENSGSSKTEINTLQVYI